MNIERTLFWFQDGDEQIIHLSEDFFGLSTLLNRLLNEKYEGKKIKFINLYFYTNRTYEMYPVIPKDTTHYFGGHLKYYGLIDIDEFLKLNKSKQIGFIWERAYYYLVKCSEFTKNRKLLHAIEYAYSKGIEINLNPDYQIIKKIFNINGQELKVSLWINFKDDGIYSKLTIEKGEIVFFEKEIDNTKNGVEFFLEMYKDILFDGNNLLIIGRKDVDYLPLKISLSEFILNEN